MWTRRNPNHTLVLPRKCVGSRKSEREPIVNTSDRPPARNTYKVQWSTGPGRRESRRYEGKRINRHRSCQEIHQKSTGKQANQAWTVKTSGGGRQTGRWYKQTLLNRPSHRIRKTKEGNNPAQLWRSYRKPSARNGLLKTTQRDPTMQMYEYYIENRREKDTSAKGKKNEESW